MAIYVDALTAYGPRYTGPGADQAARVGARNGHQWCHLFSDETDPAFPELVAFGLRLGMKRSWFQGDHFDLTPGRRSAAIAAGAKEATRSEAVEIWRRTPRARRLRCRACGYVTPRTTTKPVACPSCGRSACGVGPGA